MLKTTSNKPQRKIIHVDMDCFFAAVEIRDNPEYQNKPIAIGHPTAKRGVLATASYEARKYGVRAAMPTQMALKKCPKLIIVPMRMEAYKEASAKVFEIFKSYTHLVQGLSLDEAFIDVSECSNHQGSATLIAQEILTKIYEKTGLTASAGVANCKFLAKIASDRNKPNGLCIIKPSEVDSFVRALEIREISGVGPKSAEKLQAQGLYTCADIQAFGIVQMEKHFGTSGDKLWKLAHGIDNSPVNPNRQRKSFSKERTFEEDRPREEAWDITYELFNHLKESFSKWKQNNPGYKVTGIEVKVRYTGFITTTVSQKCKPDQYIIKSLLLRALERNSGDIRLIGVGFQLAPPKDNIQIEMEFDAFE